MTIPDSVVSLDIEAFQDCFSLKYVYIGNSIKKISGGTFGFCYSLEKVVIPVSAEYIEDFAFGNCDNLTDIYYTGSREEWDKIVIDNYGGGNDALFKANLHCNSTSHVIESNYGDNRSFKFRYGEELEDLVFSKSSTEYNPRLAHFLACMARSAYTPDLAKENYAELGFTVPEEQHCDSGDPIAGFYVGEKQLDDRKKLVMVTIRGSDDWSEWLQTNFNLGNSAMIFSVGLHSGFLDSADKVYDYLKSYLGGSIPVEGVTYVITGHSLGAAVGNILAKKLELDGVSNHNVYDYNFACPNVGMGPNDISAWNNNGEHNNIINVGNWCDIVSHEPGVAMESLSEANKHLCSMFGWSKWKRFGQSYWFDNGFQLSLTAHDMKTYIDYLAKEYNESHFIQKEYAVQSISAHCPVDVVIYDSKGNPIAGTINNEPKYYGYEPGEKAMIFIDGDEKTFHIPENDRVTVSLIATDNGEMNYSVGLQNLTSGETISINWFNSVQLTTGKEMVGKAVNVIDSDDQMIQEDKLITVGDEPMEILTDGEEVPYTFSYILGDADDSGEVETIDATWLQRFIADFATPYDFETLMHGDVDYDGEADITDVTMIQRYLAQFSTPYLIGSDVV